MFWLRPLKPILVLVLFLVFAVLPLSVTAQNTDDQLDQQLKSVYRLTQVESIGHVVTEQGVVVRVTRGNFLFVAPIESLYNCAATVKEGKYQIAGTLCRSMVPDAANNLVPEGTRFYITKIKANTGKDTVTFDMEDAAVDPSTGGVGRPSVKTAVNFGFPKGYLAKADAGQIADVINGLLVLEGGQQTNTQQALPEPIQQQPPMPPQNYGPPSVQVGMTESQVRAILGDPTSQRPLAGEKNVFLYSKQIVFQNGRVVAVQ